MLDPIVFVTQSEKGCWQGDFDSEYKHVGSVCSFSYLGIYHQGYVSCENQKGHVCNANEKYSVKIRKSKFIVMFIFLKERNV
jgi:hypothetical protein